MRKSRYYVPTFDRSSWKSALAKLSGYILEAVEKSSRVLQKYTDESYGESPRRILHYMIRNNETIFGFAASRGSSHASTSREEQSSEEPSSPVRGESSSPRLPRKQLPLGAAKGASEPSNLETEATSEGSQESVESCEETETFSDSSEDGEMKIDPKEEMKLAKASDENIKAMIKGNLVQITSMSIITQLTHVAVEIDIDVICKPNQRSPQKLGQVSGASEKTSSPGRAERKNRSPSSSPSKLGKSARGLSVSSEPLLIDFSSRGTLEFIATRLSYVLSYRKTYMKQIYNSFQEFRMEARGYYNTIGNMQFVIKYLLITDETLMTEDILKVSNELKTKVIEMQQKLGPMVEELDQEVRVWNECVDQIKKFDEKYGTPLSEKYEAVLDVVVLKNLESLLKSICSKADGIVILKEGRKNILLESLLDFESLVKIFVKFLIITGILLPVEKAEE